MVNNAYEFLDHTADLKIKVYGSSLTEVFENSVLAVSEYLSPDKAVESRKLKTVQVQGQDQESLLYNFLEELLYLIDAEGFIAAKAEVTLRGNNLMAEISGDEASKYELKQIKAPTYAEMEIKKEGNGWTAVFVLDV